MKFKLSISEATQSSLKELIETGYRSLPNDLIPVIYQHQTLGWISPETFKLLKEFIAKEENEFEYVHAQPQSLHLLNATPHNLSIELRILAELLKSKNIITTWRNEEFSFIREDGHELFRLERTAFRTFGFHSRAVHVNGYHPDQTIWLSKRSDSKAIDPNLFDNVTAGGISAGETIQSCVERELWEEAGIQSTQLKNLLPIGIIDVKRAISSNQVHNESLFTFDLLLDENLLPINQDGEVDHFANFTIEQTIDLILSDCMTKDAAIVTADFILRHI